LRIDLPDIGPSRSSPAAIDIQKAEDEHGVEYRRSVGGSEEQRADYGSVYRNYMARKSQPAARQRVKISELQ